MIVGDMERKHNINLFLLSVLLLMTAACLLAKVGKNNLVKLEIKDNNIEITSKSEEGNVKEDIIVTKEKSSTTEMPLTTPLTSWPCPSLEMVSQTSPV